MTELNPYEIERLEAQAELAEKIANASLHQRAALMAELDQANKMLAAAIGRGARLHEALLDIEELVDGKVDIDKNGNANLAMQVYAVVALVLERSNEPR